MLVADSAYGDGVQRTTVFRHMPTITDVFSSTYWTPPIFISGLFTDLACYGPTKDSCVVVWFNKCNPGNISAYVSREYEAEYADRK